MTSNQDGDALSTQVISVIEEPTQRTVPRKPSAGMLAAGAAAGNVSVEVAFVVYQAMVDATGRD